MAKPHLTLSEGPIVTQAGPSFKNPPVVERVLCVQFEELQKFSTVHFGRYHELVRRRYPIVQDQPRLPPIVERFPGPRFTSPSLRFQDFPASQRVWFVNAEQPELQSELLQLQPDRFALNWRRPPGSGEYPRYPENEAKFLAEFDRLWAFCAEQQLGDLAPNLAEVVYVNHITPLDGESATQLFGRLFSGLRWKHTDAFLPEVPESARFDRVYEIPRQRGRLYAEASIGRAPQGGELVQLKMTARVNHPSRDRATIRDALRDAHDWVVRGFVSVTDPGIQRDRWGKMP